VTLSRSFENGSFNVIPLLLECDHNIQIPIQLECM
jgi:hypothetical protein